MSELTKVVLFEQDMPTHWYNINADLPKAGVEIPPPLHPATHEVVGPDDLAPLFPMGLIAQEVSTEQYIEIPDEVREILHLWRPTPLFRARRWEKKLDTVEVLVFIAHNRGPEHFVHVFSDRVDQVLNTHSEQVGYLPSASTCMLSFFDPINHDIPCALLERIVTEPRRRMWLRLEGCAASKSLERCILSGSQWNTDSVTTIALFFIR